MDVRQDRAHSGPRADRGGVLSERLLVLSDSALNAADWQQDVLGDVQGGVWRVRCCLCGPVHRIREHLL